MGEHDQPLGVGEAGATAPPEGVGQEPTAAPEGVATEAEPTATGEQPPPTAPPAPALNLDDLPEFRSWKANYDRRMADAEKRAQLAEDTAAQTASRLEELEVRDLRPDEQATWYKTKLAEQRAELERANAGQAQAQRLSSEATTFLKKLGLEPDTPGLEWGDSATPENLARLYASAAEIVAAQARQGTQQQAAQTEDQLRAARIDALNQAGVTRASVATAGAPPASNPLDSVTDPTELIRMGIEEALSAEGRQPPRG